VLTTDESKRERGHLLTIAKEADFDPEWPHFDWDITCVVPELCGGWQECQEPHAVDGESAADGPYDASEDDPWFDLEEFTFHGVEHTWRGDYGWTIPYEGCVVSANDYVADEVHDIGVEHGEGTYVVDDEWDDTSCTLIFVRRVEETDR
jgi:hypothetical protein